MADKKDNALFKTSPKNDDTEKKLRDLREGMKKANKMAKETQDKILNKGNEEFGVPNHEQILEITKIMDKYNLTPEGVVVALVGIVYTMFKGHVLNAGEVREAIFKSLKALEILNLLVLDEEKNKK